LADYRVDFGSKYVLYFFALSPCNQLKFDFLRDDYLKLGRWGQRPSNCSLFRKIILYPTFLPLSFDKYCDEPDFIGLACPFLRNLLISNKAEFHPLKKPAFFVKIQYIIIKQINLLCLKKLKNHGPAGSLNKPTRSSKTLPNRSRSIAGLLFMI